MRQTARNCKCKRYIGWWTGELKNNGLPSYLLKQENSMLLNAVCNLNLTNHEADWVLLPPVPLLVLNAIKRLERNLHYWYKDLTWLQSLALQDSKQESCTVHCKNLVAFDTTIFQHWCKDIASEHTCSLMTISIHSCKLQTLLALVVIASFNPYLWWLRSTKDLHQV